MDIVVSITEFKHHLASCGYAAKTVESYRYHLAPFVAYLKAHDILDHRAVTAELITDYQAQVAALSLATETKALRLRPVKRFFEYLVSTHRLLINPAEGLVETCRKHRRIGPVLSHDELKKLLLQPNKALRVHRRNRAIMEVFYATGIRVDELVSLAVRDADFSEKVLFIRKAKGRKQRVVPLGKTAAVFLKEYLEKIRPWWTRKHPKERGLFLNHHGRPLTADSVRDF